MLLNIALYALLLGIIYSLGSGLYHLIRHRDGDSIQMARALTWRVGLTLTLFIGLIVAALTGIIVPHGLMIPVA